MYVQQNLLAISLKENPGLISDLHRSIYCGLQGLDQTSSPPLGLALGL